MNVQAPYSRRRLLSCLCSIAVASMSTVAIPALAAERPIAAEKNPPGDIPDTQAFVKYTSALGFSLKVPEGWARTERSDGAHFSDKFNAVDVSVTAATGAPTVASVKTGQAARLESTGRAVRIASITSVKLPVGAAVLIAYSANSEPNAVVAKQLRLEHHRYLIQLGNKLATLDLSAPLGADNVDQWKLMADSFRWN